MSIVYLGIGTNLGDRERNIEKAIQLIKEGIGDVLRVSSFYYSEPVGFRSDNNFVNVAIAIKTELLPQQLLEATQNIEKRMGRVKPTGVRYADRVIDIDILIYDTLVIDSNRLKIPHPHMAKRAFVLNPLVEIEPELEHPVLKKSIKELKAELNADT